MPGLVFHVGASATCPHAGQVSTTSTNQRVKLNGQAAATAADTFTVSACPFTVPGPKAQPCTTVQWTAPATRVTVNGQPVILQSSVSICQSADQIPAGPASVSSIQAKVSAT
jgi:uncharacterized Zn-binding protein involved in type VI secretion